MTFRKLPALLLAVLLLVSFAPGCCAHAENSPAAAQTELRFNRTWFPMSSAESTLLDRLIREWTAAHPEAALRIEHRPGSELSFLARMDHLPDLYIMDGRSGRSYARFGRALDLTGAVVGSEYAEKYDLASLMPYYYEGAVCAFPLCSQRVCAVLYDTEAFREAGYASFPGDWEAMKQAKDRLLAQGWRGAVAFGNQGGLPAVSMLLSTVLAWSGGNDWLQQMLDGGPDAMFIDEIFVNALQITGQMLADGVFCAGCDSLSANDAIECFLNGECPAVLLYGNDIELALSRLRERAPERYDALGFAPLPAPPGFHGEERFMPSGIQFGLFVSPQTAESPEKLAACIDLCRYLTGPAFADPMAESLGAVCFTRADDEAWASFENGAADQTRRHFSEYARSGMKACPDLTQYLHAAVWNACGANLPLLVNGIVSDAPGTNWLTAEEIANILQDTYESNYL